MKFFELFKEPTLEELVKQELAQAQRELIAAETSLAKARCLVSYNTDQISRLASHLTTMGRAGTPAVPSLRSGTPARADIAPAPLSVSETHQTEDKISRGWLRS